MADNTIPREYDEMYFSLKYGINLPTVEFGTYRLTNYDLLFKTIDFFLNAGYKLFDTAPMHNNEKKLRSISLKLLPEHGLVHEDISITAKITPSASGKSLSNMFENSLKNRGMDYIDLYLIHIPGSLYCDSKNKHHDKLRKESWLALVNIYDESKLRAIEVSNFKIRHLMNLSEVMVMGPMVNQIEWHPYYFQPEMIQYWCDHNIRIQVHNAFSGMSRRNKDLLEDPVVRAVAQKYRATASQVLLLWALQTGIAVNTKSNNPYYIQKNIQELQFRLSEKDVTVLNELSAKNVKYSWDPALIA